MPREGSLHLQSSREDNRLEWHSHGTQRACSAFRPFLSSRWLIARDRPRRAEAQATTAVSTAIDAACSPPPSKPKPYSGPFYGDAQGNFQHFEYAGVAPHPSKADLATTTTTEAGPGRIRLGRAALRQARNSERRWPAKAGTACWVGDPRDATHSSRSVHRSATAVLDNRGVRRGSTSSPPYSAPSPVPARPTLTAMMTTSSWLPTDATSPSTPTSGDPPPSELTRRGPLRQGLPHGRRTPRDLQFHLGDA